MLEMAGGVSVAAALGEIKVERIDAHEKRVIMSVKLAPGAEEKALRAMIGTFPGAGRRPRLGSSHSSLQRQDGVLAGARIPARHLSRSRRE